jgi:hypothetical protein
VINLLKLLATGAAFTFLIIGSNQNVSDSTIENETIQSVEMSVVSGKTFAKERLVVLSTNRFTNNDSDVENSVESKEEHQSETGPNAEKLAGLFIQQLKQPVDDNYKVLHHQTKNDLIDHLSQYASRDIAQYYVDGLFEEKDGELYIIPTELPPWLIDDKSYELKQVDRQTYRLTQENNSDLYGSYKIEMIFKKEQNWIIDQVEVK